MAGRPSLRAGTAGKGSSVRQRANATRGYNTPSRARSYLPPGAYDRQPNRSWLDTRRKVRPLTTAGTSAGPRGSREPATLQSRELNSASWLSGPIRLPLNGFTYSWTLSSKFFSTFPHGTCPLSDSCQYLALDGVYHPLWAAFPNNPTPRTLQGIQPHASRGLTPAMGKAPIRRTRTWQLSPKGCPKHHSSRYLTGRGFGAGLFPLRSPLLGESLLVSFPPLSDMLKFSG